MTAFLYLHLSDIIKNNDKNDNKYSHRRNKKYNNETLKSCLQRLKNKQICYTFDWRAGKKLTPRFDKMNISYQKR